MKFSYALKQVGRITHELIISGALLFMYFSGFYALLSPTLQTIALKATLVSLGFIHAHITGKLCFPAVNWNGDSYNEDKTKLLRIAVYIVFVYAYSHGG
jgi:hypothetical protein